MIGKICGGGKKKVSLGWEALVRALVRNLLRYLPKEVLSLPARLGLREFGHEHDTF
jgi:hypothetical protein